MDILCSGRNNIITLELFFEPLNSSDLIVVLLDASFVVVVARVVAKVFLFVVIGRPFVSSCFSMFLVAPGLDCTGKGGGAKLVFGGGTAFWGIAGVIVWGVDSGGIFVAPSGGGGNDGAPALDVFVLFVKACVVATC